MEDSAAKDRSSASAGRSASRLLRYPLRSATRTKEEKPPLADSTNSNSAAKRGKGASSVSKSVGVLDLSSQEKPAKPPRRLSVPSKSNNSAAPKTIGNITPISETRAKWTPGNQGKSDTPLSDVSKSSHRKKFSVISSSSYWLSQIRLSESAAKHSISLGFFKLALEAGCEPIQRVSDELKLYVRRHSLSELSESVKELFESYKINENFDDQSQQVSETSSQVPQLSDNDDVKSSSSSITEAEKPKPKPKPLDKNVAGKPPHAIKATNETQKKKDSEKKMRRSAREHSENSKTSSESRGRSIQRKPRKASKQEPAQDGKDKVKKQGKKAACDEGNLNSAPNEALLEEDKENMDDGAPQMEETNNNVVEI